MPKERDCDGLGVSLLFEIEIIEITQEEKPQSLEQQPAAFILLRMSVPDLGKQKTSWMLLN